MEKRMTEARDYNINLRQVTVDGERLFEARVHEFPDATEYAETPEEAYELALETVADSLEVLAGLGRPAPQVHVPAEEFSGRVTLRLPKNLHARLSSTADNEGVSLNHYLVTLLAHSCGTGFDPARPQAEQWKRPSDLPREVRYGQTHLKVISCNQGTDNGYRRAG